MERSEYSGSKRSWSSYSGVYNTVFPRYNSTSSGCPTLSCQSCNQPPTIPKPTQITKSVNTPRSVNDQPYLWTEDPRLKPKPASCSNPCWKPETPNTCSCDCPPPKDPVKPFGFKCDPPCVYSKIDGKDACACPSGWDKCEAPCEWEKIQNSTGRWILSCKCPDVPTEDDDFPIEDEDEITFPPETGCDMPCKWQPDVEGSGWNCICPPVKPPVIPKPPETGCNLPCQWKPKPDVEGGGFECYCPPPPKPKCPPCPVCQPCLKCQ